MAVGAAESALTVDADTKFILLHETRNEEGIRGFFHEVWEVYVKVCWSSSSPSPPSLMRGPDDAEPVPDGAHDDPEQRV